MMEMRRLPFTHGVFYILCLSPAMTQSISLSKHGCQQKCGNVTIPYPFGIGSRCSANSSFTMVCNNSTHPPKPILSSIDNLEVLQISLNGTIIVNQRVSPLNCSYKDSTQHAQSISLLGSPFYISSRYNALINLGCRKTVWLLLTRPNNTIRGCITRCRRNSADTTCNGDNCCDIPIPARLQELQFAYQSTQTVDGTFCGYAFPVQKKRFLRNDPLLNLFDTDIGFAPLVIEWEYYDPVGAISGTICNDSVDVGEYLVPSLSRYCYCKNGYEGNPYLPWGCTDIDECSNATLKERYCGGGTCVNTNGSYKCYREWDHHNLSPANFRNRITITFTVIGSVFGALCLLYGVWRCGKFVSEAVKGIRRYMFYKRNGGLLLEQHLASTENGLERTKLFTSKELTRATDHYSENRILGRGGQGTVYKGMLTDGKIVAVKKSKKVDEGDVEVFINEVVILSQINHRNVVRLLGCCLETEVPLLVYEFIPNGTLFHHIHERSDDLPLTWEMRMRIASEVAGALAYLHSASSAPIYHRDIKSTNILLDEKYRAKVSDFGASRSVSIDQTHVTTRVLGTFGYLDPEYFQSSQFTEKSDVYSFGVVVVELLTGEKAVTSVRAESGKSLATHFLHTMEENQLFDILDSRVLKEGKVQDIVAIAELANKCLHLNGKKRPTMKEVSADLQGIRRGMNDDTVSVQHLDHNSILNQSVEVSDASSDFSLSIYASSQVDTITNYTQQVESRVPDEP
ncbi:wall-associated receptor kinase-like 22 [Andrographis paniculata]|uniref:wall-associated receptor kinase-like 22 n=1 Tax=Andrographis paniculata TaxID=175694 RepID=UPI0021E95F9F|nr:wall-associated receptor kinase-like 22 [Andrographis paniculata]XP_051133474.1 wall-associated receptor kinase-like 22 [Andrographis paniculata]